MKGVKAIYGEGRPVLSGLPKADNTLLQELCKQPRYL